MKFTGQIALFKGGACFNDFSQSIVATGDETFRIYSYMIEPSAHLIRRYGRMRVIQDGTSNLIFISNFKSVLTCMGDPPRSNRWILKL